MTEPPSKVCHQEGSILLRSVLVEPQLAAWTSQIDAQYQKLESARAEGGLINTSSIVPPGQQFVPTASSFTIGVALSDEGIRDLILAVASGPAGAWIRSRFEIAIGCDLDQAWIRRQYAPHRYPALHSPHGWHQDGALRFDFASHPEGRFPPGELLPMVTCWIALGSCGVDAPGLELVSRRLNQLLAPAELREESVRARFAPVEFRRPELNAGDALLFEGDILHRTHVSPAMALDRTSIELRFVPAHPVPARLKGDRFVLLP